MRFTKPILQISALAALSAFWLIFKHQLFYKINYTSDIISFLQLSRDFLRGKPLFFCNTWGEDCLTHNHFLLFLLSPLTNSVNAYGFFIAHVATSFLVAYFCIQHLKPKFSVVESLILISIFFSPLTLWLFDNPTYGWHPELLFFPLALGYGVSLIRGSNAAWLFVSLLLLTREDGAVVAFSAHAATLIFKTLSSEDNKKTKVPLLLIKRLTLISLIYLGLFIVSMMILGEFAQSRVDGALQASKSVPYLWIARDFANLTILSLPLAPYSVLVRKKSIVPATLTALLPLLIVNVVAILAYSSNLELMTSHGLTWPARFAPWLGCLAIPFALSLFLPAKPEQHNPKWPSVGLGLVLITVSFALQIAALNYVRGYSFFDRLTQAFSDTHPSNWSHTFSKRNIKLLRCLAKTLPKDTTIITSNNLLSLFHQQDIMEIRNIENLRNKANLIICDNKGGRPFFFPCQPTLNPIFENSKWIKKNKGSLTFFFSEDLRTTFKNCQSQR